MQKVDNSNLNNISIGNDTFGITRDNSTKVVGSQHNIAIGHGALHTEQTNRFRNSITNNVINGTVNKNISIGNQTLTKIFVLLCCQKQPFTQ